MEPMLVGELCWAPFSGAAHQLFALWLERWATMPRWLDVDPVWLPLGPNSSRLFCLTIACNESPGACASAVAPFRAVPNITLNTLKTQPFLTWQMANVNVGFAQTPVGAIHLLICSVNFGRPQTPKPVPSTSNRACCCPAR